MIFKHDKASNDFSGFIGSTLSDKLGFVQESDKNGGSASTVEAVEDSAALRGHLIPRGCTPYRAAAHTRGVSPQNIPSTKKP